MLRLLVSACVAAVLSMPAFGSEFKSMPRIPPVAMHPNANIFNNGPIDCPANFPIVTTPPAGWSHGGQTVLNISWSQAPMVTGGLMWCFYGEGAAGQILTQPLNGRTCTVRSDKKGFDCKMQ